MCVHLNCMAKLGQEFRISCAFCASALSIVRPYFNFTLTTWLTYQHTFMAGSHSATSLAPFWCRFTSGLARVRFSRSRAKACLTSTLAAQRPLSCASLRCPLGGNRQMVATTASIDLIANKGAQSAQMSIFTNYQVKRCGEPMLLQNWGGAQ